LLADFSVAVFQMFGSFLVAIVQARKMPSHLLPVLVDALLDASEYTGKLVLGGRHLIDNVTQSMQVGIGSSLKHSLMVLVVSIVCRRCSEFALAAGTLQVAQLNFSSV